MAIPDYQSLMLPVLQYCGDGEEHASREIYNAVADEVGITNEERKQLIRSGTQPLYVNRIAWAIANLKKANLLESQKHATYRITKLGLDALRSKPDKISNAFLMQYPDYAASVRKSAKAAAEKRKITSIPEEDTTQNLKSPDDIIEEQFKLSRQMLGTELLTSIMEGSPAFFERLVVDLLIAMGYGGTREEAYAGVTRQSGDEGIDGIIQEDRLGLDIVYIQAKRWKDSSSIGRPEIQKFAGALQGKRAKKGVFITTASFSKGALEYASSIDTRIVLIDGELLTSLMIDYNIGVSKEAIYELKKVDQDYFTE